MKTVAEVNAIMNTIPLDWRDHWCGGELGACACIGCVQIGNRIVMVEGISKKRFFGDPEYIDERDIPASVYEKYKVTKEEWLRWKALQEDRTP